MAMQPLSPTVEIQFVCRTSGPCCDIHAGGHRARNDVVGLGARTALNPGDVEADELVFTINGWPFTILASFPVDYGRSFLPLTNFERFGLQLCKA